ncbi:MAG: hypothetical protein ACOYLN_03530 [Blastocatellia bacterium]|jgi:hypothetical protein
MIKKANELNEVSEAENIAAIGGIAEQEALRENSIHPVGRSSAKKDISLVIHGWLTDIWLLTTGEDSELDFSATVQVGTHGRPLAFVSDGQMRLLGARSTTLGSLRDVGIEMS